MQVGRNEPCPCGSGSKFKKCCLSAKKDAQIGDLLWRQLGSIHDDMANRLLEHGIRTFGRTAIEEAWEEFWCWESDDPFLAKPDQNQLFMPYFLYSWTPDTAETRTHTEAPEDTPIAADYLAKRSGYLTDLERRFLRANLDAPFSFHDVVDVEPGEWFVLRDILIGSEVKVIERTASRPARKGDIIFGKVVQVDHVAMLCGTGWIMIPPAHKQPILELRKVLREAPCRLEAPIDAATLRDYDIEIREPFLDLQRALLAPPRLQNTDGEALSFHKITYAIDSSQVAFDQLKDLTLTQDEAELLEAAERGPDGTLLKATIPWHKRGNARHKGWSNTVLGSLRIDGNTLTIEVNSAIRAQRIRKEVEKRLKGRALHKSTVLQSPESMMREPARARSPEDDAQRDREQQDLMNRPEVQAHLQKTMEAHWAKWFTEKIPALGGKTPLQAAKTPDGREMLEALLAEYERNDQKTKLPYGPDYAKMRERLGLPLRPE